MQIDVGTERVSSRQMHLLERAQMGPPDFFADSVREIVRDDEIASGKEQLHPDWLDLYDKYQRILNRMVPPRYSQEVDAFFEATKKVDPGVAETSVLNNPVEKLVFPRLRIPCFLVAYGRKAGNMDGLWCGGASGGTDAAG